MLTETFATAVLLQTEIGTEVLAAFPETEFDLIAGYRHFMAEQHSLDDDDDLALDKAVLEFDRLLRERYVAQDGFSFYSF